MRDIRFRQWDTNENKYQFNIGAACDGIWVNPYCIAFDKYPLEQFTGILDKNGKAIYEGDIMFSKSWNPQRQTVVFDRGGFCLSYDESGYYPDIKYAENMEVCGNIHENQELAGKS